MKKLARLAAILLAVALSATGAYAGALISDESGSECTDWFEGTIESGDVVQFYERFGYPANSDHPEAGYSNGGGVLCLDSPGGNYIEALEIAEYLLDNWESIATRVKSGDECASACALIFLAGKLVEEGESYQMYFDRTLEPGAKLGFHAPSLGVPPGQTYTGEQITKGFNLAITASRRAYELSRREDNGNNRIRNFASPYVMARFLGTPPEDMYFIDTVGDALLADIVVSDLSVEVKLDKKLIRTICDNVYMMSEIGFGTGIGSLWKSTSLVDAKSLLDEYRNLPFNRTQGLVIHPGFENNERQPFQEHIEATGEYGIVGYATGYPDYYVGEAICVVRIETSAKPGQLAELGQIDESIWGDVWRFESGERVQVYVLDGRWGLEEHLQLLRDDSRSDILRDRAGLSHFAANPLIVFPFGTALADLPRMTFDVEAADCGQLWHERNRVFHLKGYCFGGEKGIATFGNEGCFTKSPELTETERALVSAIRAREAALGCVKP